MCLICVDIIKEKLTSSEAFKNLWELMEDMDKEHVEEVVEKIINLEQKERIKKRLEDETIP